MLTKYELILKRERKKKCSHIGNFDTIIDVTANKKVLRVYRNNVRAVGTRYEVTMEKIDKKMFSCIKNFDATDT